MSFGDVDTPASNPPCFDREKMLAGLGDFHFLAERIIRNLLKTLPSELDALKRAIEAGDCESIHRAAHGLKGATAYLYASRFQEILVAIDEAGLRGDPACAKLQLPLLLEQAGSLLPALQNEMNSPPLTQ